LAKLAPDAVRSRGYESLTAGGLQDRIDLQSKALDELAKYRPLLQKQLERDPGGR